MCCFSTKYPWKCLGKRSAWFWKLANKMRWPRNFLIVSLQKFVYIQLNDGGINRWVYISIIDDLVYSSLRSKFQGHIDVSHLPNNFDITGQGCWGTFQYKDHRSGNVESYYEMKIIMTPCIFIATTPMSKSRLYNDMSHCSLPVMAIISVVPDTIPLMNV